jgi:hypothetical protein
LRSRPCARLRGREHGVLAYDGGGKQEPRGEWFFDPAANGKRHLARGADFSTAYLHAPFLGLSRR